VQGTEPLKRKSLSRAEIEAMSDDELLNHIHGEEEKEGFTPLYTQMAIVNEFKQRQSIKLSQPHWSTNWSFTLAAFGLVISIASFWVAYSSLELSKASISSQRIKTISTKEVLTSLSKVAPAKKRPPLDAQKAARPL